MKSLIVILMTTYIFAGTINQKMIITVSKNSFQAEQSLHYLEEFFYKHGNFPQIEIKIEKLDEYFLVTLSPVDNIVTKHELYTLLQPKFLNIFTVDNIKIKNSSKSTYLKPAVLEDLSKTAVQKKDIVPKLEKSIRNKLTSFWKAIDGDWLALIALAMAGIILIFRSNYQIGKIKKLQKEIEMIQRKDMS